MNERTPGVKAAKILVISNYRPTVGARPEAEIFIGLAKAGFEVEIMTYGDAEYVSQFKRAGIRVIDFHPEKKFDPKAVAFIRMHLKEGKHDILQMYNSKAYFSGIKAARGLPVKVVLYRGYQGNLRLLEPGLYLKYFHPRVDKIICNNIGVEEEFRKVPFFDWDRKLVTINKGHRPEWYADVQPADLSKFGIKPNTFVLTCIANGRRMKGIIYLLRAMKALPSGLDLCLLLVGNGLDTKEFRKAAAETAYEDRIIFAGFQPNPLEIDRASDVFVLASIFGESLTKSVVEAMSVGTAPLITQIPGNRYLVSHGKTGLMVPPANPEAMAEAIRTLCEKRSWAKELGASALNFVAENLHTDKTVREYAAFYQDLVSGEDSYRTKDDVL